MAKVRRGKSLTRSGARSISSGEMTVWLIRLAKYVGSTVIMAIAGYVLEHWQEIDLGDFGKLLVPVIGPLLVAGYDWLKTWVKDTFEEPTDITPAPPVPDPPTPPSPPTPWLGGSDDLRGGP